MERPFSRFPRQTVLPRFLLSSFHFFCVCCNHRPLSECLEKQASEFFFGRSSSLTQPPFKKYLKEQFHTLFIISSDKFLDTTSFPFHTKTLKKDATTITRFSCCSIEFVLFLPKVISFVISPPWSVPVMVPYATGISCYVCTGCSSGSLGTASDLSFTSCYVSICEIQWKKNFRTPFSIELPNWYSVVPWRLYICLNMLQCNITFFKWIMLLHVAL